MLNLLLLTTVFAHQTMSATFEIDTRQTTPISPYIYGTKFIDWKKQGRGFTVVRQGGNRMTAYNWETNASNAGNDYHHQNDGYMGASNEPGWTARTFMDEAQANGAAVILTVPTLGYVSADKNADGDVNKTPNYLNVRFHKSLAHKPGRLTYPPDTTDKFVYQDEFVAWIEKVKKFNTPVWFSLDNEPDLWPSTHARICPKPLNYAEIIANNTEFAAGIKSVAPKTLVFGPANYGWMGFRTFQGANDAEGRDFLDVYLTAMKDAERKAGKRLLDVLDIHWYPEATGDGVRICFGEDKPGTPAARIQAPRSLWDDTYVEKSWVEDTLNQKPIVLLPRIKAQIAAHYPGTKFGITEYNYGGGKIISGALAQADVLGIFGRQNLFAATNFGLGPDDIGQMAGFRAFINYDGQGAKFGDLALPVRGETAENNSVYASLDAKNPRRLTIVAINKTNQATPMTFKPANFAATKARAFAVTTDALSKALPATVKMRGTTILYTAPALSVTTIELTR